MTLWTLVTYNKAGRVRRQLGDYEYGPSFMAQIEAALLDPEVGFIKIARTEREG